jgi:hypothetical protein
MMTITFDQTIIMKEDVLVQDLGGELVLLSLDREEYFGLDDVGTQMWNTLKEVGSLQTAYEQLLTVYSVEPDELKQDLLDLVNRLYDNRLVEITALS